MREWLGTQIERYEVPGAAVAVVAGGKIVLQEGFGRRDVEEDLPVTPDTSMALASATKAFTAATVGALVDDGLLDWDEPVRRHIPDFQLWDPVATEGITVRDMLCHRSGLPRHDLMWYGNKTFDRAGAVRLLRHLQPNRDFRTYWQYNNLMYLTAGHLTEVLAGLPWEDVVRGRLLEPLGMTSTTFSPDEARTAGVVSKPYAERGGELKEVPYAPKTGTTGPAGALYSTLTDMVAWLRVHLDGGQYDGRRVLSEATIRQLLAPQMVTPETMTIFPEAADFAYGLGWFIGTYRGHKMVHHGGNIDGFTSLVTMLPNEGIGVVFLSNKDATALRSATAYHVFDEMLGLDPIPWDERVKEFADAMRGGMRQAKTLTPKRENCPPAHPLDEYAGYYEHPAYGRLSIDVVDDELRPSFREVPVSMSHRHFETWNFQIERFEEMQLTITFETGLDGHVESVAVPFEPNVAPIRLTKLPEASLSDPEFLDRLAGRYVMGPIVLNVSHPRPDVLTARYTGGPHLTLVPHRDLTFRVKEVGTASLTFTVDQSGTATEVLLQPAGLFRREDTRDASRDGPEASDSG